MRNRFAWLLALSGCLALTLVGGAAAVPYTFGSTDSTISTTKDNLGKDFKGVNVMTSPKAGTLTKVEGYLDGLGATSGSEKVRSIVYSIDANGNPSAFLGVSGELTINAGAAAGWRTFTFPGTVSIPAGKIGIGYWSGGTTANLIRPSYDKTGSSCILKYNTGTAATYSSTGSPTNPFGSATCGSKNLPWAIRVTADDGAPPPTIYDKPVPHDGVSPGFTILQRTSAMQDWEIDQIKRVGAEIVRIDYLVNNPWQGPADTVFTKANAAGLEVELNVGGTTNGNGLTKTAATYGQECSTAATLYHLKVRYYEVMNEPNVHGFSPAQYAAYQGACYDAIKAVDSRNVVLTGGISPSDGTSNQYGPTYSPVSWVQGLYQNVAAGGKKFSVMNVHAYGDNANPLTWSVFQQTFGPNVTPNVRSVMNTNGDSGKQIWSTEGGVAVGSGTCDAPGYTTACSEQDQADVVTRNLGDTRLPQSYIYDMLNTQPGYGMMVQDPAGTITAPDGTKWRRRPSYEAARVAMGGTG